MLYRDSAARVQAAVLTEGDAGLVMSTKRRKVCTELSSLSERATTILLQLLVLVIENVDQNCVH